EGPYLPVVLQACLEEQLAFEYRHGVVGHGAFTFCLATTLREHYRVRHRPVSFDALLAETRDELRDLGYDQTPCAVGPREVLAARVPWGGDGKQARASARKPRKARRR